MCNEGFVLCKVCLNRYADKTLINKKNDVYNNIESVYEIKNINKTNIDNFNEHIKNNEQYFVENKYRIYNEYDISKKEMKKVYSEKEIVNSFNEKRGLYE